MIGKKLELDQGETDEETERLGARGESTVHTVGLDLNNAVNGKSEVRRPS